MKIIREYEVIVSLYHDEIVAKLRFYEAERGTETSQIISLPEVHNTLELWRAGALLGSFGIGTRLSESATFTMRQKTGLD